MSLSMDDHLCDDYSEGYEEIDGIKIGYCRYGNGPNYMMTVCGAVGCYAKDWPLTSLRYFDPDLFTIIGIDPPGYGTSRPPDRKQEVLRCNKDAIFCTKLMERLNLLPFTITGWSEGSRTSIHVAERAPNKVERLILLATITKVDARGVQIYKGLRNTDQWLASERAPYLKHYSDEYFKKQWADNCDMVVEFCEDPKQILPKIKNAKLETHSQGGHDFPQKFPKWTAEKITNFVLGTGGRKST